MKHEVTLHVIVQDQFNEYDPVNLPLDIYEALPTEWKSATQGADYWIQKIQSQGSEQYAMLQRANEEQGHTIKRLQDEVWKKRQLETKVVEMMKILGLGCTLDDDDIEYITTGVNVAVSEMNDVIDRIEAAQ